jgi:hypothetical protein
MTLDAGDAEQNLKPITNDFFLLGRPPMRAANCALSCLGLSATILLSLPLLSQAADKETDDIFVPGANLKVEGKEGAGGEGPAWHPKLGVLMSGGGHIYRLDRQGKLSIHRKNAGTNGLLFDPEGRLLACEPKLRRVTRTDADGKLTVLTESYDGKRYNQPNDLTMDSKGRIYFSDPRYGDRSGMEIRDAQGRTIEGVYRIDPDGKVTRIIGRELERPNGLLVSADDRHLFVADNNNDTKGGARKLWRFELRPDGTADLDSRKLPPRLGNRPRSRRSQTRPEGPPLRGRRTQQAEPALRTCPGQERGHLRLQR